MSGWARALFGGSRRSGRREASQPPATGSSAGALGACSWEQRWSLARESSLGHKFKMTVLTNMVSAFTFGFRKGLMALPRNHY